MVYPVIQYYLILFDIICRVSTCFNHAFGAAGFLPQYQGSGNMLSLDWCEGKSTGNHGVYLLMRGCPVNFSLKSNDSGWEYVG